MNSQEPTSWRVEGAGPQHLDKIRELFFAVFRAEMSEAHWRWKYDGGRGLGVVVLKGDKLVAFFGGTERRVLFDGKPLVAMQCGDSMVAESYRGILTRKGPFYLSVTAFLGKYVGTGLPYLLSYGFPNARAMRLAQLLKLYDDVGSMLEIDWRPQHSERYRVINFDFDDPTHQQLADELWTRMAAEFGGRAIGIRDFAYLKQRFYDNPSLQYDYHLVHLSSNWQVLGLSITRRTEDGLLLVDMVGQKDNLEHLINFSRHRASELACNKLYGWLTEIDASLIAGTDPVVEKDPLRLPLGVYSPGLTADDVRDKWFFLCGDSDFL